MKRETKKKVIKKLSLVDKWRNTAALLKQSLTDTQAKVEYWRGKYEALDEKLDDVTSITERKYRDLMKDIEGQQMPLYRENQWLKETIELLTIPADKIGKLEEIRRERIQREDPLNDYERRRRGY
jgi:hypothetical protein